MKAYLLPIILIGLVVACSQPSGSPKSDTTTETANNPATAIIQKAIDRAGGSHFDTSTVSFDFRGIHYTSKRDGGHFELARTRTDSAGNTIHDCLDNLGFQRTINGEAVNLPDSLVRAYNNSVNSVHYFAQLPYGLINPAVYHKLLDTIKIGEHDYFKIEVTFDEEGGGEDHDDVFLYWIHTEDYTADYLAYSYHTEGGGMRFREAINPRTIAGIRWVDYRNFKPKHNAVDFYRIDSLFGAGELELLSVIELENIEVKRTTKL